MKLGVYRHYKGNLYQMIGVACCSEKPHEIYVVYQALYGDYGLFVRPYTMFNESVEYEGRVMPRFELIRENLVQHPTVDHSR